jgi:hypothetical protein
MITVTADNPLANRRNAAPPNRRHASVPRVLLPVRPLPSPFVAVAEPALDAQSQGSLRRLFSPVPPRGTSAKLY